MTATPAGGSTRKGAGVLPKDPWSRWALALLLVSALAAVLSLFYPWWELRTWNSAGAGGTSLSDGQWCSFDRGQGGCHPYIGGAYASLMPASLAASMLYLEVLQVLAVVAFLLATATFAFPRIRARLPQVPAAAAAVGMLSAWAAVVYTRTAIPGTEAVYILYPSTGFSGAYWSESSFYTMAAWGAGNAWFLLFLAGGTGLLALLAQRAGARSERRSRAVKLRV